MTMPCRRSRCRSAAAPTIGCVALAIVGLLAPPSAALAQVFSSSLDVGIASGSALAGPVPSALLLQPAIRWDRPSSSFDAQASWLAANGMRMDGDASLRAHYFSPVHHGLRLELGAAAQHIGGPDVSEHSNGLRGSANLSLALGAGGVWLSTARLMSSSATLPSHQQMFGAGGWRRVGGAIFTASVTTSSFGIPPGQDGGVLDAANPGRPPTAGDSLPQENTSVASQYADVESSVYWSHGPLTLDALLGTRVSSSYGQRATWGRAQASWALGDQFALVAAGGTRAPEPAIGRTGGDFLSLGVRLASAPWIVHALHAGVRSSASAFGVRADGAMRIIYVHAPAARTIELMADFTDWQPVVMRHAANDEWEIAMRIEPGSHRLNIRVDGGEWSAPPGAGVARDEFNGVVGLVVVP